MPELQRSKFVKVRVEGGSVVLTVGKAIPASWKLVEIIPKASKDDNKRLLEIVRVA